MDEGQSWMGPGGTPSCSAMDRCVYMTSCWKHTNWLSLTSLLDSKSSLLEGKWAKTSIALLKRNFPGQALWFSALRHSLGHLHGLGPGSFASNPAHYYCILGHSRWWVKYLGPCHLCGRPRQIPGFDLPQSWPLWPCGEWTSSRWKIFILPSLCKF